MEVAPTAPYVTGDGPVAQRAHYNHEQNQKKAVTLLLVGSVCGLLGFLFAGLLGTQRYYYTGSEMHVGSKVRHVDSNFLGNPFASGNNYKPQTVSEMVYNPRSPEGKSFFAFCLIGAICILTSWYPWQLRNVYIGDDAVIFGRCGPTWLNVRQYCPPVGMLLVACIPTTPPVNRTLGDRVTGAVHILGAVMMIGGYAVCELFTLLCQGHRAKGQGVAFKPGERTARLVLILLSLGSGIAFQICGALAPVPLDYAPLPAHRQAQCADVWLVPSENDLEQVLRNNSRDDFGKFRMGLAVEIADALKDDRRMLYDTATGSCLTIKTLEYWFEVLAGLFMIASHLTIWYFCPERHIDLPEKLPDLSKEELRRQGYDEDYIQFGYDGESGSSAGSSSDTAE